MTERDLAHMHKRLKIQKEEEIDDIVRVSQVAPVVKNPLVIAENARDVSSVSGSERSLGVENGNPLQYSCLENPMDRGAWWATVHGVAKSWIRLK